MGVVLLAEEELTSTNELLALEEALRRRRDAAQAPSREDGRGEGEL